MRAASAWMLSGVALLLAGCGGATSGIVAIGPDMFAVETRGRVLANAVERGLTEATSFCMSQGRQTELLGTRINADNYQVAFRCVGASTTLAAGSAPIGRVPVAMRPSALGPVPLSGVAAGPAGGPMISGQAFAPPPPRQPGLEMGTVAAMPMQPAPVAGNPFAGSAGRVAPMPMAMPMAPVSMAPMPMAAPGASVPAVGLQPLQSPLGAAAPAPMAPPPAPVSAAPLSFEPPRFAEPPRSRSQLRAEPATEAPAFMPPPPAADPLQPLQSPLAGGAAAPAPSAAPLPAAAPASGPVFQTLPPAAGGLPQARSALQPVAAPR